MVKTTQASASVYYNIQPLLRDRHNMSAYRYCCLISDRLFY